MKKVCFCAIFCLIVHIINAQAIAQKLKQAVEKLQSDPVLKHGMLSLYVTDLKTGLPVYEKFSEIGMAAASTQKLFTSAAAYDLLGKDYRFKTEFYYTGRIENGILKGDILIMAYGDPSFGSWRWSDTKQEMILKKIVSAIRGAGIKTIEGNILLDISAYTIQPVPDGWIWQDIGNYYGAGCWALNWNENQYDLTLRSGNKEGDSTIIVSTKPALQNAHLLNRIMTGKKGSGDNAYIYLPPYSQSGFATGTIPLGEEAFVVSGSFPNGPQAFLNELQSSFLKESVGISGGFKIINSDNTDRAQVPGKSKLITIESPPLDSLNYWFLKKSINLYGEALLKIMAFNKMRSGATETGVEIVKDHWEKSGIDRSAINIIDGSGLSPQNRVTTHSLARVLQYAKTRPWFSSFYYSLPEYNGMKMKSGSIGGSRAFAGYHTSSTGKEYAFAIIVNNYDGSSSAMVRKLYSVLDVLK